MPRLKDNFRKRQLPGPRWLNQVSKLLNDWWSDSPYFWAGPRPDYEGMEFRLDVDRLFRDGLAHPFKVTVFAGKWSCTDGTGSTGNPCGRVWTRENENIAVTEKRDQSLAGNVTIVCKLTVPDAGGTPTAVIEAVSGTVDYWSHAAGAGVIVRLPLATIAYNGGNPSERQLQFSDINAFAGCNVNDDATGTLSDGATEFLVLTLQGAAGATAAAKVRKLTVQVDHGHVIRWTWGTPATGIGQTGDVTRERVVWETPSLVKYTRTETYENGVLLRSSSESGPTTIVTFADWVCPTP